MSHMIKMDTGEKGFTLIEIVMVMVLLSIVGVISVQVISSAVDTFVVSRDRKELYDQGRLALERMTREIRVANAVSYPAVGNSGSYIDFTKEAYGFSSGAPSDTSITMTFQVNGIDLERIGDVSGTTVLASDVSSFLVTHEVGNFVTLELSLNSSKGGTVFFRTKVYPRNL